MNIIFDLDGTLGDTLPLCIRAFREAIEPLIDRSLPDAEIIAHFGPSEEGLIMALVPNHYDQAFKSYLDCYRRLHRDYTSLPFEGITEILKYLKDHGAFVGLVTGKGAISTQITLDVYGLNPYFNIIKTGSSRGPVKEEKIGEIIAMRNDPRESYLYVGDAPTDVDASRTAGIKIAAAGWARSTDTAALRAKRPDYFFETIPDFRAFIEGSLLVKGV